MFWSHLVMGLRIYGQASFADIFKPILDQMNGLVWVVDFDEWLHPEQWESASEFDAEAGYVSGPWADFKCDFQPVRRGSSFYGYVSNVDIFPKYAAIIGDRQSVFGLHLTSEQAEHWLIHTVHGAWHDATPPYVNVVEEAELSFLGHESWREFYTQIAALLGSMKAHLPQTHEARANPTAYTLSAAYEVCYSTRAT